MPDAPRPITSPPALPWQPYDTAINTAGDPQSRPEHIYDALGGSGPDPWPKLREGGVADMATGVSEPGRWDANGTTNTSGPWKNT